MTDTQRKRQREKAVVGEMIALYCRKLHHTPPQSAVPPVRCPGGIRRHAQ